MCDEAEILFYGMTLWGYYDGTISNNYLGFDYYAFNKSDRLASPKFKLYIKGKTAEGGGKTSLGSSDLYRFTYQLKQKILKNIKSYIESVKKDQDFTTGFSFQSNNGKNIYVTFMWNSLANDTVIRFMIGEKEKTILDSDKVYIPILDFFSLCEILDQSFKNYLLLCSSVIQENSIRQLQTTIENKDFVTNIETVSHNQILNNIPVPEALDIKLEDPKLESDNEEVKKIIEISKSDESKENEKQQESFDSFLKENRDSFELDMPQTVNEIEEHVQKRKDESHLDNVEEIVVTSKFIDKVCNNDFSKLEEVITNSCNEDLPFDSFVQIVQKFTDIDFKDGIDNKDYLTLNYVISRQIKTRLNLLLEHGIKLPSSTAPVIIKSNKKDNDKLDTMYYLLLFYIYISKVRTALSEKTKNSIDNKDCFTYLLKMVTSPLVFSFVPETPIEVTKSEIIRRFNKLNENGFFNNFISNIKSNLLSSNINVKTDDINESIDKIYQSIEKFGDKLNPGILFDKDFMHLTYDDFKNHNDLTLDIIKKVTHCDWSLFKFKKVDVESLSINSSDDIPKWVCDKYGIKSTKFDTGIIVKYFTDNYKNFPELEHIKCINKNVYDVIDKIDFNNLDDNALKALYFWDSEELPKTLTYLQFKKMIDESSLERSQLLSMIINKEKVIDPNFFTSFLVSADNPD